MFSNFPNLHTHTDVSNIRLLDCINKVGEVIDYALELNMPGIAITDHECLSNHVQAQKHLKNKIDKLEAKLRTQSDEKIQQELNKAKDFKLMLGNEIYLVRNGLSLSNVIKGERYYHFILIAKDLEGHKQLRQLSSRAWGRSFRSYLERVPTYYSDIEDIVKANPGHLIATTACLGGFLGTTLLSNTPGSLDKVNEFLSWCLDVFGDDFYLEIQPGNTDEQITFNKKVLASCEKNPDAQIIITTDAHYLTKDKRLIHKAYLNSKEGEREVDAFYGSTYLMSSDEAYEYLKSYVPESAFEWIVNKTREVADKCVNYTLRSEQVVPSANEPFKLDEDTKLNFIDHWNITKESNLYKLFSHEYAGDRRFADKIIHGLLTRIPAEEIANTLTRVEEELEEIKAISEKINQPLSEYFNSVATIIEIIWDKGDSLVGPARGSAMSYVINYLIGITQINPLKQAIPLPLWRFLHRDRPELPDIDIDIQGVKRNKVLLALKEYFGKMGGNVINVATFGTEGAKSAILTACRALNIDSDIGLYLSSLVPVERGFVWPLKDCYYGNPDEGREPQRAFINEIDQYDNLKMVAMGIEGLINKRGIHAGGIIITNTDFTDKNAIMRAPNGTSISQYNLGDTEFLGGLKIDLLSIEALDKIRACLDLLLEYGYIDFEGSLKKTYDSALHPNVLEYDNLEMWDLASKNEILDLFQFNTAVGAESAKRVKPQSIIEMSSTNSLMRLMPEGAVETPVDTFIRFKNNINEWYVELRNYGLTEDEIKVLEKHLLPLNGVADSQESVMLLSMDPKITSFTVSEANKLRKGIAKKDKKIINDARQMFFDKGVANNTSKNLLNYIWYVQIGRQLGYSFCLAHSIAYSHIALQQLNLVYKYPIIFWNCACLIVNSGANSEEDNALEDFDEIDGVTYVTPTVVEDDDDDEDEEDADEPKVKAKKKTRVVNYGKIATAIGQIKSRGIRIELPNINKSKFTFTPVIEDNTILYGLKGITRVGDDVVDTIIANRPYTSLEDFMSRIKLNKLQMINLIKSGAFDILVKDANPRVKILTDYISEICGLKKRLTLQNVNMLIERNIIPDAYDRQKKVYYFNKYLKKECKLNTVDFFINDPYPIDFYHNYEFDSSLLVPYEDGFKLNQLKWDKIYKKEMDVLKKWMTTDGVLDKLNQSIFQEQWDKYAVGSLSQWEFDAVSFYYTRHELANIDNEYYDIVDYNELPEEPRIERFSVFGKKQFPRYYLHRIAGTVLDKNKIRHTITLLTTTGVVNIKFYKDQFAFFDKQLSVISPETGKKVVVEKSWFKRGNMLLITGFRRGDLFVPKTYTNHRFAHTLEKITDVRGQHIDTTHMRYGTDD